MAIRNPNNMRGPLRSNETPATTTPESPTVISSSSVGTNPTTFLYDVGLQNIYQDYQKNIATLNTQEQQSLQDAYYIREMSKKYLGEYASNVGMGDVSGNLLDIYGQYQQTVAGVGAEFGARELTLQQQYDASRRELEMGKTAAEIEEQRIAAQSGIVAFSDISSQTTIDLNGNPIANPNYVPNFDFTYYNLPAGFNTSAQSVYRDAGGNEYYNQTIDVDKEAETNERFNNIGSEDLFAEFARINGENATPTEGDIVPLNGVNYVLRDGKFYRLQTLGTDQGYAAFQRLTQVQKNWVESNFILGDKNTTTTGIIRSSDTGTNRDLIYVNLSSSMRYTNANSSGQISPALFNKSTNIDSQKAIVEEFQKVHGVGGRTAQRPTDIQRPSVITYQGKLYYMNSSGDVWQLRPKDAMSNN